MDPGSSKIICEVNHMLLISHLISSPQDNCVYVHNPDQRDFDRDGFGDACDNCASVRNNHQMDIDFDSLGDECDPDRDGDGLGNNVDNCPSIYNPSQEDADRDGRGDLCDNCLNDRNFDQVRRRKEEREREREREGEKREGVKWHKYYRSWDVIIT